MGHGDSSFCRQGWVGSVQERSSVHEAISVFFLKTSWTSI